MMGQKRAKVGCAGINRQEVGNARVLQERSSDPS
jgi:hypothetical protein